MGGGLVGRASKSTDREERVLPGFCLEIDISFFQYINTVYFNDARRSFTYQRKNHTKYFKKS